MCADAMNASVVLTRPQGKNEALAERLAAANLHPLLLPALHIKALPSDPARVPLPCAYDLVIFVSGHAVKLYLQALNQAAADHGWPALTLAATVGAASARQLEEAACIGRDQILYPGPEASQDSESLWRLLEPHLASMRRVLIVRGSQGREWLGSKLQEAGLQVHRLALYARTPVLWNDRQAQQLAQAMTRPSRCVFLLTSSESVDAVHGNVRRLGLAHVWAQSRFVVIHERVARRLQSSLQASGKVEAPMVKICQPGEDSIFQMIMLAASL